VLVAVPPPLELLFLDELQPGKASMANAATIIIIPVYLVSFMAKLLTRLT
jgi:hypothetical protein